MAGPTSSVPSRVAQQLSQQLSNPVSRPGIAERGTSVRLTRLWGCAQCARAMDSSRGAKTETNFVGGWGGRGGRATSRRTASPTHARRVGSCCAAHAWARASSRWTPPPAPVRPPFPPFPPSPPLATCVGVHRTRAVVVHGTVSRPGGQRATGEDEGRYVRILVVYRIGTIE
jgi:hypothetical protein